MPVTVTGKVEGLEQLAAALRGLKAEVSERLIARGSAAGAAVVRDAAKAAAPKDSGKTARAIFVVRDRQQSSVERAIYHVGVRSGKKAQRVRVKGKTFENRDAYYWKFLEFGHWTRTVFGRQRSARRRGIARAIATAAGRGPRWVPPQPFLRPALENNQSRVVERIAQVIREGIRKATKPPGARARP